jgi:hypothetical protein
MHRFPEIEKRKQENDEEFAQSNDFCSQYRDAFLNTEEQVTQITEMVLCFEIVARSHSLQLKNLTDDVYVSIFSHNM